jgi:nicotinamidase-related amidase
MTNQKIHSELPMPPHFDPQKAGEVWKVPYQERAVQAEAWAEEHNIHPADEDEFKIALIGVDIQNTFCLPDFELYVGRSSENGPIGDTCRMVEFIYRNLANITDITATLDTHQAMQIFHAIFLVNNEGRHPGPLTVVTADDVRKGLWKFNPAIAPSLGIDPDYGQKHLQHYVDDLEDKEKFALTIWPYHSMLGGIGHALVSIFEEALFFYTVARMRQVDMTIKARNPLTEHYSVIGPEVLEDHTGAQLGHKADKFIQKVENYDAVIIGGQAKSHCVAWTIDDLLRQIRQRDGSLASKVYLLEDCTSPVAVPGVVDYTEAAEAAFQRFADSGMHLVRSTDPISEWPGLV